MNSQLSTDLRGWEWRFLWQQCRSDALFHPRQLSNEVPSLSILGIGQLWDTATLEMRATLQGFLQGTHSVGFSPDGERLAIGGNGNEATKLWDVESLQELLTPPGQGSMFNATAFSPDGSVLASNNGQGLLQLWRAPSFEDIARWEAERH